MKVKITAILLMVVLTAAVFAGCDVITKNEERDYNQTVAEVNYGGLKAVVTKAEVYESYNSYGYYYTNYYGKTLEETFDLIIDSLAQRKLLILYARCELAKDKGLSSDVTVDKLLTEAEVNKAVTDTNSTMQSWFDNIVKELEEEAKLAKETSEEEIEEEEETEEEETLTARKVRPDDAEPEFDAATDIPDADLALKFFDANYDHGDNKYTAQALKQLKKELADNYRTYEYYLERQYESRLLESWQRKLSADYVPSDAEIAAAYESYLTKNIETFANDNNSSYTTAIKSSSVATTVYHPVKGYGYVYNILLSFSDEQKAELKAFTANNTTSEEIIKQYRANLAKEIKVNISNPDYDPDFECEGCAAVEAGTATECTETKCKPYLAEDKNVPVQTVITKIYNEFKAVDDDTTLNAYQKFTKKREVATKWVYLVNDDTGMYTDTGAITENGMGYQITPDGTTSTYVDEFTDLGREMVNLGLGTYTIDGTAEGMYCVTEYGIHIMFVSYIPYDTHAVGTDGTALTVESDQLPLDYVVYYGRYGSTVDVDQTLRTKISDSLIKANKTDAYTVNSQKVIADNKDSAIEIKERIVKKMIKEIEG
jgi:hypothetical protein